MSPGDDGSGADGDSLLGRHRDGGFGGEGRGDERILGVTEGVQVERPADVALGERARCFGDLESATVEGVGLHHAGGLVARVAPGCPALTVVVDVRLHVEVLVGVEVVDHEQAETGVGVDEGTEQVDHLVLRTSGGLEDQLLALGVVLGADTARDVVVEAGGEFHEPWHTVEPGVRAEHVLLAGVDDVQDEDVLARDGVEEVHVHEVHVHGWNNLSVLCDGQGGVVLSRFSLLRSYLRECYLAGSCGRLLNRHHQYRCKKLVRYFGSMVKRFNSIINEVLALYHLRYKKSITVVRIKNGAPGWTRTNDLRLRSPLLYPSELPGHGTIVIPVNYTIFVINFPDCLTTFYIETVLPEIVRRRFRRSLSCDQSLPG